MSNIINQQNTEQLITDVSNALRYSVPKHVNDETMKALERCHDLMARSLPHIKHKELQKEVAMYANILEQYFHNGDLEYYPTTVDLWLDDPETTTQELLEDLLRRKGIKIPEFRKAAGKPKRKGRK
jgi:hypothetical protein